MCLNCFHDFPRSVHSLSTVLSHVVEGRPTRWSTKMLGFIVWHNMQCGGRSFCCLTNTSMSIWPARQKYLISYYLSPEYPDAFPNPEPWLGERTSNCHERDRHRRHPCCCDHWDHACPSHAQASCGQCMASSVLKLYATAEGKMKVVEVYKPFTVLSIVTKTLPSHHMATNELRSKSILLLHIGNLHWWVIPHHCDTPPSVFHFPKTQSR